MTDMTRICWIHFPKSPSSHGSTLMDDLVQWVYLLNSLARMLILLRSQEFPSQGPTLPPYLKVQFSHFISGVQTFAMRPWEKAERERALFPWSRPPSHDKRALSTMGIDIKNLHSHTGCSLANHWHLVIADNICPLQHVKEWSYLQIASCRPVCCYRSVCCTKRRVKDTLLISISFQKSSLYQVWVFWNTITPQRTHKIL